MRHGPLARVAAAAAAAAAAALAAAAAATALAALAATALSTIASKSRRAFATHGEGRCSFQNLVTPTGFYMLNSTAQSQRGVCAPGLVQSVGEDNSLLCLRELSYPRVFVASILQKAY